MKKFLQKIKNLFLRKKGRDYELSEYVKSIPRDEKGRWIFPESKPGATLREIPEELLGNRDWMQIRDVLGDKAVWEVPCTCGNVDGKCEC